MRSRARPIRAFALIACGLSAALAGCSSGGSPDSMATSSLRPQEGMRRYPDGSTNSGYYPEGGYGRPYAEAPRQYVDPGQPTPREMAAYESGHQRQGAPSRIETASIGPSQRTYDPNARWQQPSHPMTTGSAAPVRAPAQQPYAQHAPNMVQVREGDTLYSLSRRFNVPMGDLMAANRLPNERIAVGQTLVIPTRYR